LIDAKEQIAIIRQDISDISKQLWSIANKMKTPDTVVDSFIPADVPVVNPVISPTISQPSVDWWIQQ
jgi:hypothetical protein